MASSIPPGAGAAVQGAIPPAVITFDAGQVLIGLDLDFLARRLGERRVVVAPAVLGEAERVAWGRYDELVGAGAAHPWHALMSVLLAEAGVRNVAPLVDWLWSEQPRANLWRKPIPEMVELARELARGGARVAVLSNSEGRLAELLAEIGIADPFDAIIDSGVVGFSKPDPRIFHAALAALGVADATPLHIGDVWAADVVGARGVGWRAMWFGRHARPVDDPDVFAARDPAEARAVLVRLGLL